MSLIPRTDLLDQTGDRFGKSRFSFPTPNIADRIYVEKITIGASTWKPVAYGTAHPSKTGAKLIWQSDVQGDDTYKFVHRIYATDRVSQDAYDFTLKYTAESIAHKIIVRESLELRSTYAPTAELAPDSVTASCLCTYEDVSRAEPEYDSLYIKVLRVFEDFGTRAQQDVWNGELYFPYLSTSYPRIKRTYRFPANNVPAFVIGTTADTVTASAFLTELVFRNGENSKQVERVPNRSGNARVTVVDATFEYIPDAATLQNGFGYSIEYDNEDTAFPIVTWKFRVKVSAYAAATGLSACPVPSYTGTKLTEQKLEPDADHVTGTVVRVFNTLPGSIKTSLLLDFEITMGVTETKQLVQTNTVTPSFLLSGGKYPILDEVQEINEWKSMHIKHTIGALPSTWIEYEDIGHSFPQLFGNADSWSYTAAFGTVMLWRAGFSQTVVSKVTYLFIYNTDNGASITPVVPLALFPASWKLPFGFDVNDALTDGQPSVFTNYGTTVTINLPTTVPTATQYRALIGTYIIVGGGTKRWKGNIFTKKTVELIAQ